jgi:NADH dehydrogenase
MDLWFCLHQMVATPAAMMHLSDSSVPKVVIIGGGFGGIEAAKELGHQNVKVTLIDRNNHHTFQPLLYQVATAGLSPSDIAVPIRSILAKYQNTEVILGEVTDIQPTKKMLICEGEEISFDYLIVAAGATHSYFGKEQWEAFAPGLKSLEDATEIRRRILYAFEHAEAAKSEEERNAWLTFVIVGGGLRALKWRAPSQNWHAFLC